jgi:AcrR family transcriptional regulator
VAESELGRLDRHVCAVFADGRAARSAIDDFVLEGLAAHEQVIEIAEIPGTVIDGLTRRPGVREALRSGQLEVRPWTNVYLAEGTFRAARMLAYIRRLMREVDRDRFEGARLIGTMDWAVEGLDGVEELVGYESGLNRILARPRVSVLCVYDAARHPEQRLRAIMAVHDAAVVDGKLAPGPRHLPSPRDRILTAAGLLFAENGVARTGVDTLIEAAGVAKATFYRHFPSKDDLVVAWLHEPGTRWLNAVRTAAEERASSPREIVPLLFDGLGRWLEDEDFVATPFLSAAATTIDPADPVARAIGDYHREVRGYLTEVIAATGHPEPEAAAHEIQVLIAGAIALGVATRSSDHVLAAQDAAVQLLG